MAGRKRGEWWGGLLAQVLCLIKRYFLMKLNIKEKMMKKYRF